MKVFAAVVTVHVCGAVTVSEVGPGSVDSQMVKSQHQNIDFMY